MTKSWNLQIQKPTIIAGIAYLILAIVILMPFQIGDYDKSYESSKKFDLGYRVLLLLILAIPIGLSLYTINCMVAGRCLTWSYINAIIICIWVILFITATVYSVNNSSNSVASGAGEAQ